MQRRKFLWMSALGTGLSARFQWPLAVLRTTDYQMEHIRGNVGYFSERGGTIGWMLDDEGIVVVDSQFPEQAGHFIEAIQKESQAPFVCLINTHHHGDHTSGNIAFKDLARHVVAHENSLKNQRASAESNGTMGSQWFPDITYSDKWTTRIGNELITLDYWGRAHTDGDSIIHFTNANVVHMGDLVFNRRYPYIDKGAGASITNWIEILDNACTYFDDEAIFMFGHAREGYQIQGGKEDLKAFANYLTRLLEHVGALLRSGRGEAEILKETAIPGAEEWQGDGIERSLKAAIVELRDGK